MLVVFQIASVSSLLEAMGFSREIIPYPKKTAVSKYSDGEATDDDDTDTDQETALVFRDRIKMDMPDGSLHSDSEEDDTDYSSFENEDLLKLLKIDDDSKLQEENDSDSEDYFDYKEDALRKEALHVVLYYEQPEAMRHLTPGALIAHMCILLFKSSEFAFVAMEHVDGFFARYPRVKERFEAYKKDITEFKLLDNWMALREKQFELKRRFMKKSLVWHKTNTLLGFIWKEIVTPEMFVPFLEIMRQMNMPVLNSYAMDIFEMALENDQNDVLNYVMDTFPDTHLSCLVFADMKGKHLVADKIWNRSFMTIVYESSDDEIPSSGFSGSSIKFMMSLINEELQKGDVNWKGFFELIKRFWHFQAFWDHCETIVGRLCKYGEFGLIELILERVFSDALLKYKTAVISINKGEPQPLVDLFPTYKKLFNAAISREIKTQEKRMKKNPF